MRRRDALAVISFLVHVAVTVETRQQRAINRIELFAAMFGVAIDTTDARIHVRSNHRRHKRIGGMTCHTLPFHVGA